MQELADCYEEMDFDPSTEIEVDRSIHKQFTYGNNQTSAGLGLAHLNAGICGKQIEVQSHMMEGATPFLLSAKFLYDMDATINFRTGVAVFRKISAQHVKLDRSSSNHLLLPLTAFAGRWEVLQSLQVDVDDASVRELSDAGEPALTVQAVESRKGDPEAKDCPAVPE